MSLPVLLELDKIALKVTMLGDCVGAYGAKPYEQNLMRISER